MDLSPHSEASKLLEAALEQMDGIIQGAKFEMPAYFDDANGNGSARSVGNGNDVPAADAPAPVGVTAPSPKPLRFGLSSPLPTVTVPEALDQLKLAILNDKNSFESRDKGELSLRPHLDGDTVTFLSRWLKNNPYPKSAGGDHRGIDYDDGEGDPLAMIEERLLHAESERDALGLQVSILGEQVGRQTSRLQDMDQLLSAKKELLRKTEMALDRERTARTALEESNGHLGELTRLRKRCSELERENEELRKICTGNRTPRLLNLSPTMGSPSPPQSSRNAADLGSSSPENDVLKKGVGFGEAEIIYDGAAAAAADPSPSGRPPRGLKKILGKIKRSNSGGQLEGDSLKSSPAANGNPGKSEFRRGGFRSTAGGRLGGWNSQGAMSSTAAARRDLSRRPVSEWNVDMICTWLDCLGLGMYSVEVQKTIGTGEDLAKMTLGDLENKLNVKNGMHRKKLFLALAARNDSSRPDAEGRLDFQWVLRWLDDIGLPQYKDA